MSVQTMSTRRARGTGKGKSTQRENAERRSGKSAERSGKGTERSGKNSGKSAERRGKTTERSKSKALAKVAPPQETGRRSSAAKKAYERRQQRAVAVLGDDVGSAELPKRVTSLAARIPFVASIIGLLSLGLALTLMLTTRAAEDSYQLSAARQENERLAQERSALERDVQAADSAPDLAARARELGMIPAKDPARLVVAPDGGVVVIGTPTAAAGGPVPLLNPMANPRRSQSGTSEVPSRRSSSTQSSQQRATPQQSNGPQVQAQGEQLVPMTRPDQPSPGGQR